MKRKYSLVFFSTMICGLLLNSCNSDKTESQEEKDELNDDPKTVVIKSSECDIIEFTDEVNSVNWEINDTNITAVYPAGSDLRSIAPVITISEKATVSPQSGEKVDFSNENEITYIVIAEDGTEKIYKAQASVEEIEIPYEEIFTKNFYVFSFSADPKKDEFIKHECGYLLSEDTGNPGHFHTRWFFAEKLSKEFQEHRLQVTVTYYHTGERCLIDYPFINIINIQKR